MVQAAVRVTFSYRFQRVLLAALYSAESIHRNCVYLCVFDSLNVICLSNYAIKLGLVVGMTIKKSDGKEVDIVIC